MMFMFESDRSDPVRDYYQDVIQKKDVEILNLKSKVMNLTKDHLNKIRAGIAALDRAAIRLPIIEKSDRILHTELQDAADGLVEVRVDLEGWKGDIVRLLKGTCYYCSDKTDEPLIVQGLGFKSRVCAKCKLKRGIK